MEKHFFKLEFIKNNAKQYKNFYECMFDTFVEIYIVIIVLGNYNY